VVMVIVVMIVVVVVVYVSSISLSTISPSLFSSLLSSFLSSTQSNITFGKYSPKPLIFHLSNESTLGVTPKSNAVTLIF
jgi:hypothetical protein